MRRRTLRVLWVLLAVVLIAATVAAIVLLRKRAAPEAARLLPEADAYLYANVKPLRAAGVLRESAPVTRDAAYEQFVRDTGFDFERDLDEAAFAVHAGTDGKPTRYSEIFVGRIDTDRLTKFFARNAKLTERYRDLQIFHVPVEDRTVRVALLAPDIAAISNHDDPRTIRGMIDRYKQIARPFGGPQLLRANYKHVPFGSLGWAIVRNADEQSARSLGFADGLLYKMFFPSGTVMVASVRYIGNIDFKAQILARNEEEAGRVASELGTLLSIFRGISEGVNLQGRDKDAKALFESLQVEHDGDRAIISAEVPPAFLKKLLTAPASSETPTADERATPTPQRGDAQPKRR